MAENGVSRRDLLNIIGSLTTGVTVGMLTGEGIKYPWETLGNNESFEMASRICGSIVEAEIHGEQQSEMTARKAALSWLFAETAVIVAPYVGYDSASRALRHYLYGDGGRLDFSEDMYHLSSDETFWDSTFAKAFDHVIKHDLGTTTTKIESKFNSAMRYFVREVQKGVRFQTQAPREGTSEEVGLFYTLGTSEHLLKADNPAIERVEAEKVVLHVDRASLEVNDKYDWVPGDFNPGTVYLSRITGIIIDEALSTTGIDRILRAVLINSGLPMWERELMYENYLNFRQNLDSRTSSLVVDVGRRIEEMLMGTEAEGHYNFDLSLLMEYGAKPFPMGATINFSGNKIEIPI